MGSIIIISMIHLPRAILLLALMLATPARADPLNFYKSDAKTGELERARYACMRQSLQPSGGGDFLPFSKHFFGFPMRG